MSNQFEVRKNNDVLHVFDTEAYTAVEGYDVNQGAEAQKHVDALNKKAK